jgi:23S rRNA (cytidine1920-2'-O)/16S rRNA (cytidine1409-2'-O)-methyltransferase
MPSRKVALIELLKSVYPWKPENELLSLIMRGDVRVDGDPVEKPGARVDVGARVSLKEARPFVSRGGEKLAHALEAWKIDCAGTVWLDAGCSTGGFTDCLLSRGASGVYAIDVGVNQLDWRLRADARVTVMEGTNIMDLRPGNLHPAPNSAAVDLSFRSLRRAASHILSLTTEAWGVFLVKPQFEWQRPPGEFHGVVRDPRAVVAIVRELVDGLESEGVRAQKAVLSPIRGRKGNRVLLLLLRSGTGQPGGISAGSLEEIILDGWISE